MTDRELNIKLREMARSAGLCDEWYQSWSDESTIDECLSRYIRGFDFSVKNDWPSLGFVRQHFRDEDLLRHHIYLDKTGDCEVRDSGYYVFLGDSSVTLHADGFVAVTVYCRHDSAVNVHASGGARVFVSYYDRSDGVCSSWDSFSRIRKYDRRSK